MKKFNKKSLILLVSVTLLLTISVSGTVAFLSDYSGPVENKFEPGKVPPQITEDFDGKVKSNVAVTNTGNTDAYIRAMIVVTWQNKEGKVYPAMPVEGKDNDYTITIGSGWAYDNNFYYYKGSVGPNRTTTNLIETCSPVTGKEPADGYTLHVEIIVQSIQATQAAVDAAWPGKYSLVAGN